MDACDAASSAVYELNEQIARRVFEGLPEDGLVLAIMDGDGNCWPSDAEAFSRLGLDETLLTELRARVDDGADAARILVGEAMVTVTQLATDRTNCGYLVLAEPLRGGEPTRTSQDLVETLFGQIALVGQLLERQSQADDDRMSSYRLYGACDTPTN